MIISVSNCVNSYLFLLNLFNFDAPYLEWESSVILLKRISKFQTKTDGLKSSLSNLHRWNHRALAIMATTIFSVKRKPKCAINKHMMWDANLTSLEYKKIKQEAI